MRQHDLHCNKNRRQSSSASLLVNNTIIRSMSHSKMNILYTGIVWTSTLIVCSLHIGIITRQYLLYETTTKMTIRHQDKIEIPVVVNCMSSDWTGDNVSDFLAYQHRDENTTLVKFDMAASGCGPELRRVYKTGPYLTFFNLSLKQETSDVFSVKRFAKGRKRCFAFRLRQRLFDVSRAASKISYEIYYLRFHRGEKSPSDLRYYLLHPDQKDPFVDSRSELAFYYNRGKNVRLPNPCLNYQRRETRLCYVVRGMMSRTCERESLKTAETAGTADAAETRFIN